VTLAAGTLAKPVPYDEIIDMRFVRAANAASN
jgi:hypothetical protein